MPLLSSGAILFSRRYTRDKGLDLSRISGLLSYGVVDGRTGCNGIPSLGIPPLNLATARVTYRFNGQHVAVREGVTLTFVYGDHLGSASVTVNLSGTKASEVRYSPFGETRYSSGNLPSDLTFTGQRSESYNNMYDMGVQWYSPVLCRFNFPDIIVPDRVVHGH